MAGQSSTARNWYLRGKIPRGDRAQRLVIGGALMLLTISGLTESVGWRSVLALILQTELMITAIAGWCPVYWACDANKLNSCREF